LHKRLAFTKKNFIWFFTKNSEDATDLPLDFEVVESSRSGYPFVRRKRFGGAK
jgi:hypothetical protein